MCNWLGNKRWTLALETSFQKEFNAAKDRKWLISGQKESAGEIRQAGGGAGNFTFVKGQTTICLTLLCR